MHKFCNSFLKMAIIYFIVIIGFATYYSYIGQNATNPEFEPMKKLLVDANQFAFRLDSRQRSSYPLLLDSNHPDELARRFFGIPYYKSAALIRMMDGFLTSETLRSGISRYLKKWAFEAATQDNLFEALTEQALDDGIQLPGNMSVGDIMDSWTKQRGFPIIKVVTDSINSISLIQVQNYIKPKEKSKVLCLDCHKNVSLLSWHVPISIASEAEPDFNNHFPKLWIPQGQAIVKVDGLDTSKWIVVNPDATGYFRVHYDDNLTAAIRQQLEKDHTVISPLTRSQLLDDYFNFATEGELPLSQPLEFTKHFGNETEDIVWHVFLQNLRRIFYFYREIPRAKGNKSTRVRPEFQGVRDYLLPRLEGALLKLGVEQLLEDRGAIVNTRSRLLSWACKLGSHLCLDYANELFHKWMLNPEVNPVPIDYRDFMYCYAVRAGGGKNWLFAIERYAKAKNLLQSLRLAKSLVCADDEDIINIFLDTIIDKEKLGINKDEFLVIFESLSANPSQRHLAVKFLRTRFPEVVNYLNGTRSVNVLFSLLTDYLYTEEDLVEVQRIYSENLPHITNGKDIVDIDDHVKDIKENMLWMTKSYQPMKEWFESQTKEESLK